jgi:hypothetical protein
MPYYEGKEVKRISREAWKFDPLFSRQDAYTILFDKAEEMEMEKDTSLHSVQVEWIYLKEKRVKRYYFERKKDAWFLEAINWEKLAHGEGNEEDWTPVNNKTASNFPLDVWQSWASPTWNVEKKDIEHLEEVMNDYRVATWMDIKRTDVLNNSEGTDLGDEKHIAPLQLSVIRRCVQMWSNPGETVFTPFLGIGSEIYESVKLDRFGIGIELKDKYFETAIKNINKVVESKKQLSLF